MEEKELILFGIKNNNFSCRKEDTVGKFIIDFLESFDGVQNKVGLQGNALGRTYFINKDYIERFSNYNPGYDILDIINVSDIIDYPVKGDRVVTDSGKTLKVLYITAMSDGDKTQFIYLLSDAELYPVNKIKKFYE